MPNRNSSVLTLLRTGAVCFGLGFIGVGVLVPIVGILTDTPLSPTPDIILRSACACAGAGAVMELFRWKA